MERLDDNFYYLVADFTRGFFKGEKLSHSVFYHNTKETLPLFKAHNHKGLRYVKVPIVQKFKLLEYSNLII